MPAVQPSPATKRGDVHTRTSRATPQPARAAQRCATRPPNDQPRTSSGAPSASGVTAAATASTMASSVGCAMAGLWPWPGRSTTCTRWRATSAGSSGANAPPCSAHPWSSTSGGPLPDGFDVKEAGFVPRSELRPLPPEGAAPWGGPAAVVTPPAASLRSLPPEGAAPWGGPAALMTPPAASLRSLPPEGAAPWGGPAAL